MIKPNSKWRTGNGVLVTVLDLANGYVHYKIKGVEYSCYPEAFTQRFFPISNKYSRYY